MALPGRADFDSDLRPDLDRYLATDTMEAIERAKLFHLAWDVSCSAFGSRQLHYERFFAGDAVRNARFSPTSTTANPLSRWSTNS